MAIDPRDDARREPAKSGRFERLAAGWLAGLLNERTRVAYGGDLERFRSWLESDGVASPLDATSRQVVRFRDALESDGEAGSTMARRLSALRSFYRFATSQGEVTSSPAIRGGVGPGPGSKARLGNDDIVGLRAAAERLGSRTAALIGLLLFNGMRLDEVLATDVLDVYVRPGTMTITVNRRDVSPTVEIDHWTAGALSRYIGKRRAGPLLLGQSPTRPAGRLTRFGADYLIKQASSGAGIAPPMSANTLRRTFVERAQADGLTMEEIRDRLGHRDVRTTMRHLPEQAVDRGLG